MLDNYKGNDNYGKPKQEFIDKLKLKTDEELFKTTKDIIWFSAYAGNNPKSDYHWQCDACYDECANRMKPNIYIKAYDELKEELYG